MFINAYLNLEGLADGGLNNNNNNSDDSTMNTNGADSSRSAGNHRGAVIDAPMARHARSLSMDSLIGKLNFSSAGGATTAAANGGVIHPVPNRFSLEFGSSEFSPDEMKKIMANDKLAEMALSDPKRVKRVLASRQSAARSKERKMRYIAELDQRVQILEMEATTLSAQLTLLRRDSTGIATQKNELKFLLQAMEQQAQLRDGLLLAAFGSVARPGRRLIADTGASMHAVGDKELLQHLELWANPKSVEMANGTVEDVIGFGRIEWGPFSIPNVYLVKGLQTSLISISQLDSDHGMHSCFGKGKCEIMLADGTVVGAAILDKNDGMYVLRFLEVPEPMPKTEAAYQGVR